jgi:hypothetical protein
MSQVRRRLAYGGAVALVLVTVPAPVSAAHRAQRGNIAVVARGLDNPRGLSVGAGGTLYVAEAGRGGDGPCVAVPGGDQLCYGATGAVTKVHRGRQTRVVAGLPSLASPGGVFATGPHDIVATGHGRVDVVIGLGLLLETVPELGAAGRSFGRLARLSRGADRTIVDVAGYEARANPDGGPLESNPYAALASRGGGTVVVDAAGNFLLRRDAAGRLSTLATFPERLVAAPPELGYPPDTQIPMQAVPTTVARGGDGSYYVGELTGFPYPVGGARIYRVPAGGGAPEIHATGFTAIIDLAVGPHGDLYVLEIAANGLLDAFQSGQWPGALIRLAPDGTRTVLAEGRLEAPAGLALGPGGTIYVSHRAITPGEGEVVALPIRQR